MHETKKEEWAWFETSKVDTPPFEAHKTSKTTKTPYMDMFHQRFPHPFILVH
ncbi:hypothetical protein PQX77_012897 [Marasmius sp. AFHP31]|nr:hypothetical protein PQX77_012897 [Marasmius sp. AFHP31]